MEIFKFCFPILFVSFCSSYFSTSALPNDVNWWCDRMPHPNPCKHFLSHGGAHHGALRKSNFRKMSINLALDRTLKAGGHNKGLGPKCRNRREKTAWADCLQLYLNTIILLNQTLNNPTATSSNIDSTQTWLSAALTNVQTCREGFLELGVTGNVMPLLSTTNVTQLISNSLAINKNMSKNTTSGKGQPGFDQSGKFPTWVTRSDRKLLQAATPVANIMVAQDGSGNYKTINEAISVAASRSGSARFVIRIKSGIYSENINIASNMKNIMLIGDGMKSTIITGSQSVAGGSTTFNSATVAVVGQGFIAQGITFRNTAGPQSGQAVALRSSSDLSVFYRCGFEGYQDTLYVHSQRQFYKECYIYGTIDFIFGNAAVVFQNCMIYARKPIPGQSDVVTAQGRTDPNQNTGISILSSRVMAAPELVPVLSSVQTFLGRPWRQYSRTVYIHTYLDTLVDPAGWLPWSGTFALDTLYYGEFENLGPGSKTSNRVNWPGYRVITDRTEASQFTVPNFISGQSWLPATGVPFASGL